MLFEYTTIARNGIETKGTVDAVSEDAAIAALQRRGLVVSSIVRVKEGGKFLSTEITWFERIRPKDLVIISRQIATLFNAKVSALTVFTLLASETENPRLKEVLSEVAKDIQGGNSIAASMAKHKKVFSGFYVSMVAAGEESGKLDETFTYLADYLDRTFAITSKAKNALIYPAFVVVTFIGVMILMFTFIIPKIATILTESGADIPVYTKVVLGISSIMVSWGWLMLLILGVGLFFLWRYFRTDEGRDALAHIKLTIPYVGDLYRKLYLSRLADNMNTMLAAGIPMLRAIEITSEVLDNRIYEAILSEAATEIKAGTAVSDALSHHEEIPSIMVQMMKIGEETGNLGQILETLSKFYEREVELAIDTLVGLIEPVMIVFLGIGVGTLLASVLIPIYNVSSSF